MKDSRTKQELKKGNNNTKDNNPPKENSIEVKNQITNSRTSTGSEEKQRTKGRFTGRGNTNKTYKVKVSTEHYPRKMVNIRDVPIRGGQEGNRHDP